MTNTEPDASIRFYFSFRSPYAWLAAERVESELGDLGVAIERIAIYPTPETFPNDPAAMPAKQAYLVQDISRLAREHGVTVRFPPANDPDWSRPHAAFLGAERQGNGPALMLALFRKRFSEGLDISDDDVIADAARDGGLSPDAVLGDAHSDALRGEVAAAWQEGMQRDNIFGVPSFVYAGKLYWGQDRMHFLRSAVQRKSGRNS